MKSYFKILHGVTIAIFLGVMLTPMVNKQFSIFEEIKGNENRKKAEKPVFDINNLDIYTKEYDDYYTDNFNLRQNFVSLIGNLDLSLFNISPVPDQVTLGKDGWIYATKSAKNYKGANLFSESELEQLRMELEIRTKWAEERGIQYYIAIVPNKMNIYPEHLPDQIIKISDSTRYDQVIALDKFPDINVIDIRHNILNHKYDGYELYQRADDHWNDLGAYYGYQEIMNRVNTKFPELKPFPLTDYEVINDTKTGHLASLINANEQYSEEYIKLIEKNPIYAINGEKRGYEKDIKIKTSHPEIVKVNDNTDSLKCLIIRDSFGVFLVRFFQEHFKKTVFIQDGWEYKMNEDIIDIEEPDIILNIVLETEVKKLLLNPFLKTADMYYSLVTTDPVKLENIKKVALERNLSVDEMIKTTVLWLYRSHKSKGGKVMETLMYYEFLYEVNKTHKKQTEQLASEKGISFKQAVRILSVKAFNGGG